MTDRTTGLDGKRYPQSRSHPPKPCPWCADEEGQAKWRDLCDEHRAEAMESDKAARTHICRVCETEFKGRARTWERYGICSEECRKKWAVTRERERRRALRQPVTAECQHCGATFEAARSDARYCSTKCRVAAHRAARSAIRTQ